MSEAAKSARAAMKEKAKRLAKGATGPVDASGYMQPDMLDADVKTGLRPISRRAFKKGGKVMGEAAEHHAGRKPRKAGGEAVAYANAKVNRNVKDANEDRPGKKHVGGMKKGGVAKDYDYGVQRPQDVQERPAPLPPRRPDELRRGLPDPVESMGEEAAKRMNEESARPGYSRKAGGRTKKMGGGMMDPRAAAAKRMAEADAMAGVPSAQMNFTGVKKGALSPLRGMKKGGTAEFEGSAKDVREDKKLAKKHGMSMKEWERSKMDDKHDRQQSMKGLKSGGECVSDGEYQGTRPTGGRKARKSGGRAKGKTNINIVIAQKPDTTAAMPGGPGAPPPVAPIPMPAPPVGGPPPIPGSFSPPPMQQVLVR